MRKSIIRFREIAGNKITTNWRQASHKKNEHKSDIRIYTEADTEHGLARDVIYNNRT